MYINRKLWICVNATELSSLGTIIVHNGYSHALDLFHSHFSLPSLLTFITRRFDKGDHFFTSEPWSGRGLAVVLLTASILPLISYGSRLAASNAARTSPNPSVIWTLLYHGSRLTSHDLDTSPHDPVSLKTG